MQPKTIIRFGGKSGSSKMVVEAGEIDLSGSGTYQLEIGDVKLGNNGTVRISAKGTIELSIGNAQVAMADGKTIDLKIGKAIEIGDVVVKTVPVDAGVPIDAPAVAEAPPDAAPITGDNVVTITGLKGEVLPPGEKTWKALVAGDNPIGKGSKIRTGPGTTAKLVDGALTLELSGGARAGIDDRLSLEAGSAKATGDGSVNLPGGAIALKGADKAPGDVRLDVGGATSKIAMARGSGKLTGVGDSELAMSRGESATLARTGKITPLEAIPPYYDFRVNVGETFTVHDPRGAASIQFQFGSNCPDGGIVELDRDMRFRTAKVSAGKDSANHMVRSGGWAYRLRCTKGGAEGNAVASGYVAVTPYSGTRALPKATAVNSFEADGRAWDFSYQSVIPDLAVKFPGGGGSYRLHLARGGKEITFDSSTGALRVPGSALSEGKYNYWFDRDGVKQDKQNTISITFEQMSPQVYIELPVNAKPWPAGDIHVKGAVLPNWTAAVDGITIPIDRARRFDVNAQPPSGQALAIRLSHPQRGIHYYTRRPK